MTPHHPTHVCEVVNDPMIATKIHLHGKVAKLISRARATLYALQILPLFTVLSTVSSLL